MAYIPYGYRIVNGKAVIEEKEAEKLRRYIGYYLEGCPIREAMKKAELSIDVNKATRILNRKVYLGDGYYPALVNPETFSKIAEEKRRRYERMGCYQHPGPKAAPPVKRLFYWKEDLDSRDLHSGKEKRNGMENAAIIYEGIHSGAEGSRKMSTADRRRILSWIEERRAAWQSG